MTKQPKGELAAEGGVKSSYFFSELADSNIGRRHVKYFLVENGIGTLVLEIIFVIGGASE